MPSRTFNRNSVLAGGFLLASLGLAVWASFMLSDRSGMGPMKPVTVRFTLADGATGLKRGSSVLLGGQQIGRVTKVDIAKIGDGADPRPPASVDVAIEIRRDITLYENADFQLILPLLGTLSSINISSPGSAAGVKDPHHGDAILQEGEVVLGKIAPPGFLAQAGFGPDQANQLRSAMASLENGASKISKLIDTSGPEVEETIKGVRKMTADVQASLAEWTKKVDATLANIQGASGRLDPMLTKADQGLDTANAAIADARATAKDIREIIESNKDRINQIAKNIEGATAKFDQETIAEVNRALREGRDALDTLSVAVQKVSSLISGEAPNLRRVMANLRLMSDQLKLTAIDVRSQPWRLLVQPNTKDLQEQVLYDATRTFAQASSDLRAAAESVESLVAGEATAPGGTGTPSTMTIDRETLEDLQKNLADSVEKYRLAEQALLDKLIEQRKKK